MATVIEVMKTDLAHSGDFLRTATGDIDKISGLLNLRQALFHRLTTEPGSLIHRPNYGVGLKQFQNSPSTLGTQQELALRIEEQFLLDPRVEEVNSVTINFDNLTPEKSTIAVRVKPAGFDEEEMTFIPFGEGV